MMMKCLQNQQPSLLVRESWTSCLVSYQGLLLRLKQSPRELISVILTGQQELAYEKSSIRRLVKLKLATI